jgi:hypothetical protein
VDFPKFGLADVAASRVAELLSPVVRRRRRVGRGYEPRGRGEHRRFARHPYLRGGTNAAIVIPVLVAMERAQRPRGTTCLVPRRAGEAARRLEERHARIGVDFGQDRAVLDDRLQHRDDTLDLLLG